MDAGETRRNGKTGTDGDFFVTVDPRNWKRLKEEEEEEEIKNFMLHTVDNALLLWLSFTYRRSC
jgi:hypothetical protein